MELLLNDLSIHGQFSNIPAFRESIGRIMAMRRTAKEYGLELYSHRNIGNKHIGPGKTLSDALQKFTRDEKASLLGWLTRHGPFWEDGILHDPDDYLECGDQIVTETAPGEAAYCAMLGVDRRLVSFTPSDWEYSPVAVQLVATVPSGIEVPNYWQPPALESALQQAEPPIGSWMELEAAARVRFQRLTFAHDCFSSLEGQSFAIGAKDRIISRLDVLNRLMGEIDAAGRRTAVGHQLYQDHFTGDRGWFSDSSDTEKNEFRRRLTFPHPERPGEYLCCTWHGKVNNPPYRIHFAWPEGADAPLFVTYVGLKITRR